MKVPEPYSEKNKTKKTANNKEKKRDQDFVYASCVKTLPQEISDLKRQVLVF